jgi:hypothetical protein
MLTGGGRLEWKPKVSYSPRNSLTWYDVWAIAHITLMIDYIFCYVVLYSSKCIAFI